MLDIIQERVRIAHEAEDGTECRSGIEIVVHCFSERIFHVRNERCDRDRSCKRARMSIRGIGRMAASRLRLRLLCRTREPKRIRDEILQALERCRRFLQARIREVKRAAVVRLQHEHAKHRRIGGL